MKSNQSKLRRCSAALLRQGRAAWKLLGKCVRCRSVGGDVKANEIPQEQPDPLMNPLARIKKYLLHHRLSLRVRVRFDNDTGNFALEDDDGVVHAKDYDQAVAMIKRTWL